MTKPDKGKARSQRITPEDQAAIFARSKWDNINPPQNMQNYVGWSMLFALETAMRQGEILAMRRKDLRDGFVHLPMTKNGETRDVPLSKEAKRLLSLIPVENDILVPVKVKTFKRTWIRMRDQAELSHINFHDTRHEAITRMVRDRKLPVEILAKITGHKTINILINTYYNPDAQDLVVAFNEKEE